LLPRAAKLRFQVFAPGAVQVLPGERDALRQPLQGLGENARAQVLLQLIRAAGTEAAGRGKQLGGDLALLLRRGREFVQVVFLFLSGGDFLGARGRRLIEELKARCGRCHTSPPLLQRVVCGRRCDGG
jgi:hypothetical protein